MRTEQVRLCMMPATPWRVIALGLLALALAIPPALPQQAKPDLQALVNQIPNADPGGKHTGPSFEQAQKIYEEILNAGKETIGALVDMLVEPGQGEDYKARYVLHGLVTYVNRPENQARYRMVGDALIAALGADKGPNVRASLIQELQYLGDKQAVATLGKFLADDAVCDFAARALVSIKDGAAAQLAKALPGATGRSRLSIIQALGEVRDKASVPALVAALGDQAGEVRAAAAVALSKIADPKATDSLTRVLDAAQGYERIEITNACFVMAQNLATAGDNAGAYRIYRHIWGTVARRFEPQTQYAVVQALAANLRAETTANLVTRAKSEESAIRAAILHILGERGEPQSMEAFGTASPRAAILHILGERGEPQAFDVVSAAMKDDHFGVRLEAIAAIGPVGRERSVPLLIAMLPGEEVEFQKALRSALVTVPGDKSNEAIATGLANVSAGADTPAVRIALLGVVAARKAAEAAPVALNLASDADIDVRIAALDALAAAADGSYAPRIIALLPKIKDGEELKSCETALFETSRRAGNDAQQIAALQTGLTSADLQTRCATLRVVARLGTAQAVQVLLEAVKDPSTTVQDTAVEGLAYFPNDRTASDLVEMIRTTANAKHRAMALDGYLRMAEKTGDNRRRIAMLTDVMAAVKELDDKRQVLDGMKKLQVPEMLAAVLAYLSDAQIAADAAAVAINIADKIKDQRPNDVRQAMQAILDKVQSPEIQKRAKDLMAKLKP